MFGSLVLICGPILDIADHDFRSECFVHGALVRNLLQTCSLFFAQVSFESNRTFNPVHKAFCCVRAFPAILRVNSLLTEMYYNSIQRPTLSLGRPAAIAPCNP